ncbi:MAG: 50S ribosomal protein L4 [Rhodothermales bacterium]
MEVKVFGSDGSATKRKVTLDASVFEVEPNDHVIWLDVRRIQANARQGTHKAKERNEVRGSRRKLYRQKGTGMSRAGDAKSPIRRSGGTTFGPRPRDYGFKVNKKTRRLARRSAFAYKAQKEAFRVVDELDFERVSTKELVALVAGLGVTEEKVLILTSEYRPDLYQSSRNLKKVDVKEAQRVSTLDILKADVVVMEEKAVATLAELLGTKETAEA